MLPCLTAVVANANPDFWLPQARPGVHTLLLFGLQSSGSYLGGESGIYNILTALLFGFSSLNILGLLTRRFEPGRRGLHFGEILAITSVVLSVCFLGWEMLHLYHILPIKLQP